MARKPRSDSKLDALPGGQFMELRDGLLGSWTYEQAKNWLLSECGVSSSLAALSAFYKRHCAPVRAERRKFAALKMEGLEEGGEEFVDAGFAKLKEDYFSMCLDPLADEEKREALGKLLLEFRKVRVAERREVNAAKKTDLDERRVNLLEEKARKVDELEAIGKDEALSEDEMREKAMAYVDEMLGLTAPKKK